MIWYSSLLIFGTIRILVINLVRRSIGKHPPISLAAINGISLPQTPLPPSSPSPHIPLMHSFDPIHTHAHIHHIQLISMHGVKITIIFTGHMLLPSPTRACVRVEEREREGGYGTYQLCVIWMISLLFLEVLVYHWLVKECKQPRVNIKCHTSDVLRTLLSQGVDIRNTSISSC